MGVMAKEELCEKLIEVRRVSNIEMTFVVFKEDVLRMICGHASQSGRSIDEKQSYYYKLKCELDMHSADDLVMCLGDLNGHVGRHIDGFDWAYGGYGVCQRNLKGRVLLEFCLEKELCV